MLVGLRNPVYSGKLADKMGDQGLVQSLFIKQKRKQPVSASKRLELVRGYGIDGDINANSCSPRQILIVNGEDLNNLSIPPGELRENIVLKGIDRSVFKPGAKIAFSDGAEARLTFYCEPCKRISHLVDLKTIVERRGILGIVIKEGTITIGDRVSLESDYFPALSEIPYERFLELLNQVPPGKVITYRQVLTSIGVDRSYYRVLPLYLKKAPANYPIHRVLDSLGQITAHVPQQKEQLAAEGIPITQSSHNSDCNSVSLEDYGWDNPNIC